MIAARMSPGALGTLSSSLDSAEGYVPRRAEPETPSPALARLVGR
jgi:hypothetical protein